MKKLYWRLKSWYYLKFHGVILGRIAPVAIFSEKVHAGGKITSLQGSDESLVKAYKRGATAHTNGGSNKPGEDK